MELHETLLLVAGSILFLFALVLVMMLIKKDKPYKNAIWLILISFFMMGFSVITNADIIGFVKFEKEKKLTTIEALAKASQNCPDNTEITDILITKINEFRNTEKVKSAEDNAILGYAYYAIGDENRAIKYAEEALVKDKSNTKAQNVKELAKTKILINELPERNAIEPDKTKPINSTKPDKKIMLNNNKELENKMKSLEDNPNIDKNEIKKLKDAIRKNQNLEDAKPIKGYQ